MTCETCKKLRAQIRRTYYRRYYKKHREQILARSASPEKRAKQKEYGRAYYVRNKRAVIDKTLAWKAAKKRRYRAKLERERLRAAKVRQTAEHRARIRTPEFRLNKKVQREMSRYREMMKDREPPPPPPDVSSAALLVRLQEHHAP